MERENILIEMSEIIGDYEKSSITAARETLDMLEKKYGYASPAPPTVISDEEIKQFWTDAWAEMNVNINDDEEEILALKIFLSKVQAALTNLHSCKDGK